MRGTKICTSSRFRTARLIISPARSSNRALLCTMYVVDGLYGGRVIKGIGSLSAAGRPGTRTLSLQLSILIDIVWYEVEINDMFSNKY